ncbi:MAG: FimB/Mfa2 family fimbrial subunit [Muribaculaceae bacterium]|nr:FimB/Mfa2 family fimbrial subunit [Muribaculaceae bacterium]
MLHFSFINKSRLSAVIGLAAMALSGCSLLEEDLPACPAQLQLQFVYDYNLLEADAFASQVTSVNVWAFDLSGACVWSGVESGESLKDPNFTMVTPLGEGTYDFVVWAGLDGNSDFEVGTYTPSDRRDLDMKLKTETKDGLNISSSQFKGLFHGTLSNITYTIDPMKPSIQTETVSLIKDTNTLAVMLQNENGHVLDSKDFTVSFSYADSWLDWNNQVMPTSPLVTYTPWSILYGETTLGPVNRAEENAVRSTLLYELSLSRLILGGNAYLDVFRNTDGKNIIHLPLIEFLILGKGNRYSHFGDQEYLDRRDDFSAMFFIDEDNDWYMAAGIYINGWAVVPPQNEGF